MTTQLTSNDTPKTYTQDEYAAAFAIAKDALTHVAHFHTPPTPDVYEIWYRYVEGANSELSEQLSFVVNELKSIGRDRIEQIYKEFFARADADEGNADLTDSLASELGGLESIIHSQMTISDDFDAAVSSISENLREDADPDEVRGCVEAVLTTSELMQNQLRQLKSQLEESESKVATLRADILESQKSLHTDPLTGVGNRRFFDAQMKQSIDDFPRTQSSQVLLLIDLDKFKDINDAFGHAAGDEVLRYVTSAMQRIISDASIARYGGDEFAVFMSCDEPQHGLELANELCEYFASNRLSLRKTGEILGNVTLSIGMAIVRSDDTSDSWFERADKLLYRSKQSGRNRVMAERKLDLT